MNKKFVDYINKLKIKELNKILEDYNLICKIYKMEEVEYSNLKKKELVKLIDKIKLDYIKGIVSLLNKNDYDNLVLLLKNNNIDFLNECRGLINYLSSKHVLWLDDGIVIPQDINLKEIVKSSKNEVTKSDYLYTLIDGIMIAYGVVDLKYLDSLVKVDNYLDMLEFNYHKDYLLNKDMLVSKKLSNKKRIERYYKDNNYCSYTLKEFVLMGKSLYHHEIKAYKKFIKVLKTNYVFTKKDILFIDEKVVIPYLYNSINEEDIAYKNLEEVIGELFEFKGRKLMDKMLLEIVKIRNYFPLWELRGHRKEEK